MKSRLPGIWLIACAPLLAWAVAGQSAPSRPSPPSYKLIAVTVSGSKRFTSEEIAAASGLPAGTVAREEDFKKAARQLGESGAFSNISFNYAYTSNGTKLQFQVADAENFVPVTFTDFVWFSDDEIRRRLHERIPLFSGELPGEGRLPDQVSDVLQALLVENGIPGHVEFARKTGKEDKLESFAFDVAGVSIRIHKADFPGAGPGELPLLQAASQRLIDREYSREFVTNFTEHSVLPIFREHGYLKARCAPAQPKVVKLTGPQVDELQQPRTFVDVTFAITPGSQYTLSGWEWAGNKEIATDALDALMHGKTGQTANTIQLGDDLRAVQDLYGSKGFVVATIKADAQFDDAAGRVLYRLEVNEGPVFRMGELEFRGLDNNLTGRLRAAWKIRAGEVYDASYLHQFLDQARKLLPANLDWEVDPHVTALAHNRTVDVDLQYTAKAPR